MAWLMTLTWWMKTIIAGIIGVVFSTILKYLYDNTKTLRRFFFRIRKSRYNLEVKSEIEVHSDFILEIDKLQEELEREWEVKDIAKRPEGLQVLFSGYQAPILISLKSIYPPSDHNLEKLDERKFLEIKLLGEIKLKYGENEVNDLIQRLDAIKRKITERNSIVNEEVKARIKTDKKLWGEHHLKKEENSSTFRFKEDEMTIYTNNLADLQWGIKKYFPQPPA